MDKWLAQIGLKGRALQSAVNSCDENFVDDLSALRILADDKERFEKVFPQGFLQTMILKALAKQNTSDQQTTEVKQEHETDNRYADDLCDLHKTLSVRNLGTPRQMEEKIRAQQSPRSH